MVVGLVAFVAAFAGVGGLLFAPDFLVPGLLDGFACSAANNLPCRPLTLECLVAGAGGLGVAWPAISNDPPLPPEGPYDEGSDRPQDNQRDYAPEPPPGYEPTAPPSPQDALNDGSFKQAKEDWARENSDRYPTIPDPQAGDGDSVYDTLIKSIQNKEER